MFASSQSSGETAQMGSSEFLLLEKEQYEILINWLIYLSHGSRYNITHFYCLAVEVGLYSDLVVFACRSSVLGSISGWDR